MSDDVGLQWQVGVWDRMSRPYRDEIDARFEPVVRGCLARADLRPGHRVLDLGTGTGAIAAAAAPAVEPGGTVTAVDISPEMLAVARERVEGLGLPGVTLLEGRAEDIPAEHGAFDVVIASLSLMFAIDRSAAARECARVLVPGGRFVAAVWGGPEDTDLVRFQRAAGSVSPPPVPGVGPGALADPSPFLVQLADAGIDAVVESETVEFGFDDFEHAWSVLAGVSTADLDAEGVEAARRAVRDDMWPDPDAPRTFTNVVKFVVGSRRA